MLDFIERWREALSPVKWDEVINSAGGPKGVAVVVVDMVNGFCHAGSLFSPRIGAIIPKVVNVVDSASRREVKRLYLYADCHPADAREFRSFPQHCLAGSEESKVIPELERYGLKRIEKNSLSAHWNGWEERFSGVRKVIVIGNCTDLCVYQAAMGLNLLANERNLDMEVIVPADAVETYDLPGIHPGDLFHWLFLYHMHLNGVRVCSGMEN